MAKQTSRERRAEKRAQEAKLIAEMDEAMAELNAENAKTEGACPQSTSQTTPQEKKKREVKYTYQPMDEATVKKTRLILGIVCVAIFVVWLVVKSIKG